MNEFFLTRALDKVVGLKLNEKMIVANEEKIPLLSTTTFQSKNLLRKAVINLQAKSIIVLPDSQGHLKVIQVGRKVHNNQEERISVFSSLILNREEYKTELVRDILLVPDLQFFDLSLPPTSDSDNHCLPVADLPLNLFILTKNAIEHFYFHSQYPEQFRKINVYLNLPSPNPKELYLLDSKCYQHRLLLFLDSKGELHRLTLWKKSITASKSIDFGTRETPSNLQQETVFEKLFTDQSEQIMHVAITPDHFYEKIVGYCLLKSHLTFPLYDHTLFPSRRAVTARSLPPREEKMQSLILTPHQHPNNSDILALSSFCFFRKDSIEKATPQDAKSEQLLDSIDAFVPSKTKFSHILPGTSLREALHVPTRTEIRFWDALSTNSSVISHGKDLIRPTMNTETNSEASIVMKESKQELVADTNFYQALFSISQFSHDEITPDRNLDSKTESLNSNNILLTTIDLYSKDNSMTVDPAALNQTCSTPIVSIQLYLPPDIRLDLIPSSDSSANSTQQWSVYSISALEYLFAVSFHPKSHSPMILYYHLAQHQLSHLSSASTKISLHPCYVFRFPPENLQQRIHGIQFLVIPSYESESEAGIESFLSYKSTPTNRELPSLLVLLMKRSSRPSSGQKTSEIFTPVISISTQREYDYELYSVSLPHNFLLSEKRTDRSPQTQGMSCSEVIHTAKTSPNWKVPSQNDPLGAVLTVLQDIKTSMENRFNDLETRLDIQQQSILDLQKSIALLR